MTEFFGENAWRLLAINYFFKNSIVDVWYGPVLLLIDYTSFSYQKNFYIKMSLNDPKTLRRC